MNGDPTTSTHHRRKVAIYGDLRDERTIHNGTYCPPAKGFGHAARAAIAHRRYSGEPHARFTG
jgi:hypothetical protein